MRRLICSRARESFNFTGRRDSIIDAGTVVVDLTRVLAGPYCTMVLSDLAARVSKVERPETGDDSSADDSKKKFSKKY